jgi:hypothetical protein
VKVNVFEWVPVRSASFAPTGCLTLTVTASLLTGPAYESSVSGLPSALSEANGPPVPSGLAAFSCSGCGSANWPLTRRPVDVLLGS